MNKRDAYGLGIALAILCGAVHAQGFNDQPTCYSWEGGHKSSGSFSKCPGSIPPAPVKVAAAAPAAPVVPAPIVQAAPVQQTCAPPPKPVIKPKRKPPVKC